MQNFGKRHTAVQLNGKPYILCRRFHSFDAVAALIRPECGKLMSKNAVVGDNILIAAVNSPKTSGNHAELNKPQFSI